MNKYIEADTDPAAWKITYVSADGTNKTAIHGHNAIGDYRTIDATATSEPLYAIAQPVHSAPCGGCGEASPDNRCMGCQHVFFPTAQPVQPAANYTYASTQQTNCAECGLLKHTPLRVDRMEGYVCLTCIDKKLESLLDSSIAAEPAIEGGA